MTNQNIVEREKDAKWYVVHTYSGHENKVKINIEKMVENRGMEDDIFEVFVPTEEYIDPKSKDKDPKERKLFPGYVLIKMIINDDSWYLVRNTRGVTGFVGPASKPVPLSSEEVRNLGKQDEVTVSLDLEIGDTVQVISGHLENSVGKVDKINLKNSEVRIVLPNSTKITLDLNEVEKM